VLNRFSEWVPELRVINGLDLYFFARTNTRPSSLATVCSLLPSSAQMQLAIQKSQPFARTQRGGLHSTLRVEWPMNVSIHGLHYTGSCCVRTASWTSVSTGKHHVCETRPTGTVDELFRSRHQTYVEDTWHDSCF